VGFSPIKDPRIRKKKVYHVIQKLIPAGIYPALGVITSLTLIVSSKVSKHSVFV
jgi:hypothetical protein